MQERCNSSAYALELCLSCTNPLIWKYILNRLIHYGLVMPYGVIKSGTKPLPEPLLANPQWGLLSFTCGQLYRKCFGTFPWYKGSVSSLYPPHNEVVGGVYWFHSVRPSVRPSVRLSVRLSVRPSVPHAVSALYHLQLWMDSFHIRHKWSLPWEGVSRTMTFDLDLYLQGHLALT